MDSKKKNLLSLIINICIVVFTAYSITIFFTFGGTANMMVYRWMCLRYFTNLSNIFAAIAALVMIPFNIKNLKHGVNVFPKKIYLLKFMATVSVTVTLLRVVFFLGPMAVLGAMQMGQGIKMSAYFQFFAGNTFFLHFLTPVIAIYSVVFLEESAEKIIKKAALLGLVPTVLYSILYVYKVVFLGPANGGWFDFYGFTFGGNIKLAPVSLIVMYLFTYAISRVEIRKAVKSQNKKG